MRKLLFITLLAITMTSCDSKIIVESIADGKTMRLSDGYGVSKIGDTLVVEETYRSVRVYGKYNGNMPKDTHMSTASIEVKYNLVKRVR